MDLEQRGGSLMFTWGPPWQWWPKFQRTHSGHYPGAWALVWLWWSLWYVPRPAAALLCDAAMHVALEKERDGRRYVLLPKDFDEHDAQLTMKCASCGKTWEAEPKEPREDPPR